MKCNHYWDETAISGIYVCICGASRFYNRETKRYVVVEEVEA